MELRSLRHVVALARTLNFVRAGEQIGLSQSALTRSIQAVERECGLKLFDRDRGGVHLTRAGRAFVERAESLLANAEELTLFTQRARSAEEGEVPFGMEPLVARALLPGVLPEAIRVAPRLRNRVWIRSIEALAQLLKAREIDFFVSAENGLANDSSVKAETLGTFPLSFLVRAAHPALTDEKDEGPYPVLLAGDAGVFDHLPRRFAKLVSGPRHIVEDYDILTRLTEQSDAILIASTVALWQEMAQGRIRELPVPEHARRSMTIAMYTLARRSQPAAVLKLKDTLRRAMPSAHQLAWNKTP